MEAPNMSRDKEVLSAFNAIRAGTAARALESQTLDFKEQGRSVDDTIKELVEASLCFANASGGVIAVGVSDKVAGEAAFIGTSIAADYLKRRIYDLTQPHLTVDVQSTSVFNKPILLIYVPQSPEIHSDTKGRAPHRVGTDCLPLTPSEMIRLREERLGIDWSAQVSDRPLADLSDEALAYARSRLSAFTDGRHALSRGSVEDLLRGLGVLSPHGQLLKAGELLFCEPRANIRSPIVYQYRLTPGGEPRAVERIEEPLVLGFRRALDLIAARQDVTLLNLPNGQQLPISDFPELAVREAVANALIHRDYHVSGPVTIEHAPSAFVVTSPGPLVTGVTPENILTHPSKPRNHALAAAFRTLGLAEELGRGVDRMFREMIRSGRSTPRIENAFDLVRLTLVGGAPNTAIARFVAQLPEEEREDTDTMLILLRMCSTKTLTAKQAAPILQKTIDEAEAALRRLSSNSVAILEPTRQSLRSAYPTYRLRADALKALGPAVGYQRRTLDDIDRKAIAHVAEYGKITNRTIQNLFDIDVHRAKAVLADLVDRGILIRTSKQSRGPGVEYGPGPEFPATGRPRKAKPKPEVE
jgi:ATP-dependent DNA helicase RecG